MPVSIVLSLGLASKLKPQRDVGRHIHGWFFHMISEKYSKDFATLLHGSNAYTLSGLFPQPARFPGDYYVRITSISEKLSDFLLHDFANKVPATLRLGAHMFDLEEIAIDKHPMAKKVSFQDLSAHRNVDKNICVEFVSPTSFHSDEIFIPLPVPFYVYNSILAKWNNHAPKSLIIKNKNEFLDFVTKYVAVTKLNNINSSSWSMPKGGWHSTLGFEGTVQFSIVKRSKIEARIKKIEKRLETKDVSNGQEEKLISIKTKEENWHNNYAFYCSQLHCLSEFAFYCGVGHHTAEGMGQIKIASRE